MADVATFGGQCGTWGTVCNLWSECISEVVDIIGGGARDPQYWGDHPFDLYNKDLELEKYQQEQPQKHFQKLIDISYDFKLYRKFDNKGVSLRSFCTNNNAAYVAVEETYGDHSYNGHAKKDEAYRNNMTNFGILMEINGIEDPFKWSRDVVNKLQFGGTGLYYSPSRIPSTTSEGNNVTAYQIEFLDGVREIMGGYFKYVEDFIEDMKKIFPTLKDDWGVYIPEVKYLSPEPLVNHKDLGLSEYPDVHFVGDALSARGITVSGAQGILAVENLVKECEWDNVHGDIINWR